ncbi:hypothetical protein IFM89_032803 [Coptis chinensis]|uniref:Lactoylglutathione lyase n=1 Tax=Coptis chinensis TaxID=261450 RepID=A0A835LXC7_9MAGN|nr:hypothetical protein IFM89_032803 [Coptis chinensis]
MLWVLKSSISGACNKPESPGNLMYEAEGCQEAVDLVKAKGEGNPRARSIKGGNTIIAFVEDPDGYKFELLERGPTPSLCAS